MQKSTCSFSGNERVDLKCTTQELQAEFYLGHKEDCSLEDSTSDSSEKLLQRGREKDQYICDFGEGGIRALRHIFSQKVSTSLMKLRLVTRNSCHHEGF